MPQVAAPVLLTLPLVYALAVHAHYTDELVLRIVYTLCKQGKQLDVQSKRAGVATRTTTKVAGPTSDQVTFVPEDELKKLLHDVRQGVDNLQWCAIQISFTMSTELNLMNKL